MKHTRFFVEDILRPDFGSSVLHQRCSDAHRSESVSTPTDCGHTDQPHTRAQDPEGDKKTLWPAWVYCTRYSDRPSAGPRTRKMKRHDKTPDDKRPRTAFTEKQLDRLKEEFDETHYLSEDRRRTLAAQLSLNEAQIKIWFQNKRAKLKKNTSSANPLAEKLMEEGLYNHSTFKQTGS